MDKRKRAQVRKLNTEAIRRILGSLAGPENKPASPEYPLGGLVHISGIGQVPVEMLRDELKSRA